MEYDPFVGARARPRAEFVFLFNIIFACGRGILILSIFVLCWKFLVFF